MRRIGALLCAASFLFLLSGCLAIPAGVIVAESLQQLEAKNFSTNTEISSEQSKMHTPGELKAFAENITCKAEETVVGNVIAVAQNQNTETLGSVYGEIIYFDEENQMLSADSFVLESMLPGQRAVFVFSPCVDVNGMQISADHYTIHFVVSELYYDMPNMVDSVEISHNDSAGGVSAQFFNHADTDIGELEAYVLYYKDELLIGAGYGSLSDLPAKNYKTVCLTAPYGLNGEVITYDDYEILLNFAYAK